MSTKRLARVNELLRREISEVLLRLLYDHSLDPASVTVTRVNVSPNLRAASVWVSMRGTDEQQRALYKSILESRPELQSRIGRDLQLKYTPRLHFERDNSIAEGDAVLKLLQEIDGGE